MGSRMKGSWRVMDGPQGWLGLPALFPVIADRARGAYPGAASSGGLFAGAASHGAAPAARRAASSSRASSSRRPRPSNDHRGIGPEGIACGRREEMRGRICRYLQRAILRHHAQTPTATPRAPDDAPGSQDAATHRPPWRHIPGRACQGGRERNYEADASAAAGVNRVASEILLYFVLWK